MHSLQLTLYYEQKTQYCKYIYICMGKRLCNVHIYINMLVMYDMLLLRLKPTL